MTTAGITIVDALEQQAPPGDLDLWLVGDLNPDVAVEERFAQLVGMPMGRLPRCAGSGIGWENTALPGTTAFVVELPPGAPALATVREHVAAVRSLLG